MYYLKVQWGKLSPEDEKSFRDGFTNIPVKSFGSAIFGLNRDIYTSKKIFKSIIKLIHKGLL